MDLDESSIAEHSEVLGNLRLVQPEPVNDLSYRTGPVAQEFDNFESVGFGQCAQRLYHLIFLIGNILIEAYIKLTTASRH
jgi:hypothetical protein